MAEKWRIYSLVTPPLCRNTRVRRVLYLVSGVVKVLLVPPLGLIFVTRERSPGAIVACAINATLLLVSGALDMIVYASAPEYVPSCGEQWPPDGKQGGAPRRTTRTSGTRADGPPVVVEEAMGQVVHPAWFETRFSYRHRLCVVCNRTVAIVSAVLATAMSAPLAPQSGFRLLRNEDAQLHLAIYSVQVAGSFVAIVCSCWWTTWPFRVWIGLAALRMAIGLVALSTGEQCLHQLWYLRQAKDATFTELPLVLQKQAQKVLLIYIANAFVGGCSAYLSYLLASIAFWARSKKWIYSHLYLDAPVVVILCATFIANFLLRRLKEIFCNYSLIFAADTNYPPTSAFADSLCQAISFSPRLNGAQWLIFALIVVALVQGCFTNFVILNPALQPREWTVAEELLLSNLRKQRNSFT